MFFSYKSKSKSFKCLFKYYYMGIEEILFSKSISKNIRNVWNRVEHRIESVGNKIREKLEIAKEVMPHALMNTLISSNSYGRIGYYSAKAYFSYKTARQAEKGKIYYGKSNIIVPLVVGSLSGLAGFAIAALLGDLNSLNHHYQELQLEDQQLQNQIDYLENETLTDHNGIIQLSQEYQNITQQLNTVGMKINYLENETTTDHNSIIQLSKEYQNITQQLNTIGTELQNLENETTTDHNSIIQLSKEYQQLVQQINAIETEIQNLENQIQNLINQVQNGYTLEDILFGNGNSNDISVIQINSVQIENGTAYIQGTVGFTGNNVTLEIPINYVENNNVNIQEFVNFIQQYQQKGWTPYIAIDRADLQYMNQSGWVISIQLMNQRILH